MKYIDTDGTEKTADATAIISSTTSLSEGWYYVKDNVTLSNAISFSGTVYLILNDSKTLTVNQKFSNGTLVIYGQSAGTGTLKIDGSSGPAMIQCTNVTINGGTVDVTSTSSAKSQASISGSGGVTINGGTVNVTRDNKEEDAKACIESSNGNVTINGGTVNVKGTGTRAYIGANVTINGGTVNVENTNGNAAYIGGSGSVTINGGQVTVTGTDASDYKAGITCGSSQSITLGYTTYSEDFIQASGYYKGGQATNPTIETGKALVINNTTFISTVNGTFKAVDASGNDVSNPDLKGKKLTPALAVTFNANGGTGDSYTQNGLNNDIKNLTANTFTRTGYTFEKWNTESDDSGTSYTDGQQVTLTDNFTLYAQWNLNTYKITYELNDGTNDSANPASYTVEDSITLKAPTKTGYTFNGWTLDGKTITEIKDLTGDITLIATWTPITYSITYNLDGGSATNPISYTIETESFTLNNPVKDGYTFTGWTGTDLTTAKQTVEIKKGSTGDRTYTANYTQNQQEQEQQQEQQQEQEQEQQDDGGTVTLSALEVSVTGALTLTTTEGTAITSPYTASVKGTYSDGTSKTLTASDYSIEWNLDKNISGIQISNNGTLSINDSAKAGSYELTITAKATQGSITGSGTQSVNITVSEQEQESEPEENKNYEERVNTTPDNLANMTTEEKAAIKHLELTDTADNKITDLSQVKFDGLTNLTTLDLTKLDNLETADLSQLPESVKEVNLENTNITSLTLNGSTVEKVNAKGCQNLEEINAEDNESLTELNVSDTNITSINVKNCANLQKLECSSCDIDSENLTLDGCENLNYLDITNNHFSWFNYRANVLKALSNLLCSGQRVTGWYGKKTFDFSQFFSTGDVMTADNETSDAPNLERVTGIKAYDESGNELTAEYDSKSGLATFSGTPIGIRYYYETGFNDQSMDVTIIAEDSEEAENMILGNSGGCNSGLSLLTLLVLANVLIKSKIY